MSYRNEKLPDKFSQGSAFGLGFNTHIVELESMAEQRVPRTSTGRRRYTVNLGIWNTDELQNLYKFYIAVAQGATFSFRFKDWFDYSTTTSGVTHNEQNTLDSDEMLQHIAGRAYQLVKRYNFGSYTSTRTISKPVVDSVKARKNGSPVTEGPDYTVDYESGTVTFTGVDVINSATAGFEFDTVCRFEKDTDELFQVALHGPDTGELPSVGLIEDLSGYRWSEDRPMGGAAFNTVATGQYHFLNQANGLVQGFLPTSDAARIVLPDLLDVKAGGPHFVIKNLDTVFDFDIVDISDNFVMTVVPLQTIEIFVGFNVSQQITWYIK